MSRSNCYQEVRAFWQTCWKLLAPLSRKQPTLRSGKQQFSKDPPSRICDDFNSILRALVDKSPKFPPVLFLSKASTYVEVWSLKSEIIKSILILEAIYIEPTGKTPRGVSDREEIEKEKGEARRYEPHNLQLEAILCWSLQEQFFLVSMVRRSKRLRVEVEVEGELGGDNETGEVSKYFKKEDRKEEEVLKSSCRKDDVDVEKVKKMDAYEYYDWVNARTKDDIGDIELVERKGFPRNFIPIYSKVRLMRSKIATPVDSVGCAMLPVTVSQEFGVKRCHISPKNYRFQLLIALMLSSQTRDEANAKAMFNLMQYCYEDLKSGEGLTLDAMFDIDKDTLTELLYPVSFYTRKTMYIKKTITLLRNNFDDDVPPDIAGMLSLPGVGPKMGYLALQKAWGKVDGIGVDVHVDRLCKMWKWVDPAKAKTPEHTRRLLEEWLPYDLWYEINPVLVGFGQVICLPRGKRCDLCMASDICNAVDKKLMKGASKAKGFRKSRGNYSEWVEYMENSKEVKEEIESDGDEKLRVTSGAGKS